MGSDARVSANVVIPSVSSPGTAGVFLRSRWFISRRLGTRALHGFRLPVRVWALPGVWDQDYRNQAAAATFPAKRGKRSSFWARRLAARCSPTVRVPRPRCLWCRLCPPNKGSCDQDRKGCCRVSLACGSHSMWRRWAGAQEESGASVRAERPLLWPTEDFTSSGN